MKVHAIPNGSTPRVFRGEQRAFCGRAILVGDAVELDDFKKLATTSDKACLSCYSHVFGFK